VKICAGFVEKNVWRKCEADLAAAACTLVGLGAVAVLLALLCSWRRVGVLLLLQPSSRPVVSARCSSIVC